MSLGCDRTACLALEILHQELQSEMRCERQEIAKWSQELKDELRCGREELAEWRSGKRRVFWRLYEGDEQRHYNDFTDRDVARHYASEIVYNGKLYRVTVRPKVKP